MPDTIREQTISALVTRLGEIRVSRSYNTNAGANVLRTWMDRKPSRVPCVVVIPGLETVERTPYGADQHAMEVVLEGANVFGEANPSEVAELLLGDLIECATARKWTVEFESGGSAEITAGGPITDATSAATAVVDAVELDSGSWAGGDAAGTLTLRRLIGKIQSGDNLNIPAQDNVATTSSKASKQTPETGATSGLAEEIRYVRGGSEAYPSGEETHVATSILLEVVYRTIPGNPYAQP